ncbi:unnamed protein product [Adineta steineri]|uniref:RING-type domain-containing protein n=1 Tax=Adineta steineri TaxID=433720 RepID=A0A814SZ00_9BILA|nr:unnamed protein product [Adineta steineri]CAF3667822.1 unnamed protein product [Adineta steineri]
MAETHEFHFDDDGINSERIVNDEYQVTNEFFCTICQSLLWKPKSCASCQHLFCDKCIQKWKRINSTSCPFCCTQYEEKRVSPYIHSLLGRLSIRCRNSSFGCTEILSYNSLEQHETNECQYPTKQCHICGNYVLIDASDQHQSSCNPALIECRICKHLVDSESFSQHMSECFQTRLDDFIDRMTPIKTPAALPLQRNNGNTTSQKTFRFFHFLNGISKRQY